MHGPTDPTGSCFISYRRSQIVDVALFVQTLHERGVPTWQDVRNLGAGRTETQVRAALAGPHVASGVLWLSPDVADSRFIRDIEAPLLLDRVNRCDGFFVVPVAVGGLDYAGAARTLDGAIGLEDLTGWNIGPATTPPLALEHARTVADRVLKERTQAIAAALPLDCPLTLGLFTRAPAPISLGSSFLMDWSQHFAQRVASAETWDARLQTAIADVVEAVRVHAHGRRVEAFGLPSIPAAVVLGAAFLAPKGVPLVWRQEAAGRAPQFWSLDASRAPSGFQASTQPIDVNADDLAVLVCVSECVENAVAESRASLPRFRARVHVERAAGQFPCHISDPGCAVDLAHVVVDAARRARREHRVRGRVHLFLAGPSGLAVLIGQLLNSLGPVQTYEHIPDSACGRYEAAALLTPGST